MRSVTVEVRKTVQEKSYEPFVVSTSETVEVDDENKVKQTCKEALDVCEDAVNEQIAERIKQLGLD